MQRYLYSWGIIQFEIYPVNITEVDHVTGTDWAKKEIAGAAVYREWVGEADEEIHLRGKLFPHYYASRSPFGGSNRDRSGMSTIDVFDHMRRLGQAHILMRGDGENFGWFVVERLSRGHAFLGNDGIGQQITFEATFMRVPVPDDPASYFSSFWGNTGPGAAQVGSTAQSTGDWLVTGGTPPPGV